ncbi:MAG: hypothetical protein E6K75_06555 [Candidatus Eisenbacteria bacterium]|uniref:Uncharacterized protein n=1 Tax=Eiseniibacteriota bacterium TaxID=2212470 RepID=A0A538T1T2_UNCEI|nr:MAG: hypothetical protein E6K75_06555 [Candidatus Eisenbacteria bacterium]
MSSSGPAVERRLEWAYLAVTVVLGAAVVVGTSGTLLGPVESGAIAVILLLACAALALGATRWIPGLLFTLVPAVSVFNTRHGFFPFDYVVFALAFYLVLDALWRRDLRLPGPRSLHVAFLAVIASGLLTLFLAREFSSFAGHLKRVIVGYLDRAPRDRCLSEAGIPGPQGL